MIAPPALILTAGLGTRLQPLTATRAKPAVPVGGVPLIVRILRWLRSHGVTETVLNLHHCPASIAAAVGDGSCLGLRARYSWEQPRVLGSGGGPRHALPLLAAGRFLIVNGDTLTDIAIDGLISEHDRTNARVTLAVVPNRAPARYGGVLVSDEGVVTGFTRRGSAEPSWHFVGLQAAQADVFARLQDGLPIDSIGGVYRALMAADPRALRAWRTDGDFVDVGTPADYLWANARLADAEGLQWPLVGAGCSISPTATLTQCVLWDDVVVGAEARLDRCVVADGARIPQGARYTQCAIAPSAAWAGPLPSAWRLDGGLVVAPLDPYASPPAART